MKELAQKHVPAHETLFAGLLLLFVGGYLEAYTYILRGGVFCNAQTGNLALMVMHLAQGDLRTSVYYLIPIIAFFMGVLLAVFLRDRIRGGHGWVPAMVIFEMVLLFFIGLVPLSAPDAYTNVTISFLCAMQFENFKLAHGIPYASTFCTGNLRLTAEHTYAYFRRHDKESGRSALRYAGLILSFAVGVLLAALLCGPFGARAAWVPILALGGILWMLRTRKKTAR